MSTNTRIATVLALCAATLVSCADEAPEPDTASAAQETPEIEAVEMGRDEAPTVTPSGESVDDDVEAELAPREHERDDAVAEAKTRAVANPLDEELCVVPEGGLDLPTPEMREVVITGREEDTSRERRNTLSNAGTYRLLIEPDAEGIAVGVPFSMRVSFEMTDGSKVPGGVFLDITAYMPQHFHGMNVTPIETPLTKGEYEVENMVFHMTGVWEVYFDLSHRGVTERAQFVFEVK